MSWVKEDPDLVGLMDSQAGLREALGGKDTGVADKSWERRMAWVLTREVGEKRQGKWTERKTE